jgi:hypothetical protein
VKVNMRVIYKYFPFCALGLIVLCVFIDFAYLNLNSPDACIYLSTAKNIADHKGFVVSYNLSQSFKTLYYPVWPYYQSLYSIFCSIFIDHGGITQVIKMNIVLYALNVSLIFYIVQQLITTRFNILFIAYLAISFNFFISALYAWTEQLHFFCFIISFILFLRYFKQPRHLWWLGFLNGIFMLIRVAHIFNFLAYLPFILFDSGPVREKLKRALIFVGGFILFYGSYQMFCWYGYHAFYPQYVHSIEQYNLADEFGAVYDLGKSGIQAFPGAVLSWQHWAYVKYHILDSLAQMSLFAYPALFYFLLPKDKRQDGGVITLCFWQSICSILGYSFSFYWTNAFFEAPRFSIIPFVLISVSGWYCLYQGISLSTSKGKKLFCAIVLLLLFCPKLESFIEYRRPLNQYYRWESLTHRDLMESLTWIDGNLPKEILVASDQIGECSLMHRPFISIPPGRSYNCQNLMRFNQIYSPDYYLLSSNISNECFDSGPIRYSQVHSMGAFRVLRIKKD